MQILRATAGHLLVFSARMQEIKKERWGIYLQDDQQCTTAAVLIAVVCVCVLLPETVQTELSDSSQVSQSDADKSCVYIKTLLASDLSRVIGESAAANSSECNVMQFA